MNPSEKRAKLYVKVPTDGGNTNLVGVLLDWQVHCFCTYRVGSLMTRYSQDRHSVPLAMITVSFSSCWFFSRCNQRMDFSRWVTLKISHECLRMFAWACSIQCRMRWCALRWQPVFKSWWPRPIICSVYSSYNFPRSGSWFVGKRVPRVFRCDHRLFDLREVQPTHSRGRNLPWSKHRGREGVKKSNLIYIKANVWCRVVEWW